MRGLANIPTSKLRAELDRRGSELERDRDRLIAQLAEIDQTLADFGRGGGGMPVRRGPGRPPGRRGPGRPPGSGKKRGPGRPPGSGAKRGPGRPPGSGRGRNAMSLVESLAATLRGKTMGVSEVSDAVQQAGYKTTSPNFRTIVNQALIGNPKRFRKVARGQYTAK